MRHFSAGDSVEILINYVSFTFYMVLVLFRYQRLKKSVNDNWMQNNIVFFCVPIYVD